MSREKELFFYHLQKLLPIHAPSLAGKDNGVVHYILEQAKLLGRPTTVDSNFNVIVHPKLHIPDAQVRRAIVAHTDHVGGSKHPAGSTQSIKYCKELDCFYNEDQHYPMGGDDKVGVAAALTAITDRDWLSAYFPIDEEIGCVGSNSMTIPETLFAVQLDRRGEKEITSSISGQTCFTKKTTDAINLLKPADLKWVSGATTDMGAFLRRGLIHCGCNFACGYYNPHQDSEFIIFEEAWETYSNAVKLLDELKDEDIEKVPATVATTYSGRWAGHSAWESAGTDYSHYFQQSHYTPPNKASKNRTKAPSQTDIYDWCIMGISDSCVKTSENGVLIQYIDELTTANDCDHLKNDTFINVAKVLNLDGISKLVLKTAHQNARTVLPIEEGTYTPIFHGELVFEVTPARSDLKAVEFLRAKCLYPFTGKLMSNAHNGYIFNGEIMHPMVINK